MLKVQKFRFAVWGSGHVIKGPGLCSEGKWCMAMRLESAGVRVQFKSLGVAVAATCRSSRSSSSLFLAATRFRILVLGV